MSIVGTCFAIAVQQLQIELDGREIWSPSAGGALTSLASKQCLAVPSGAAAGARVVLAPCDGPDTSTAESCREMGRSS